MIMIMAMVCAWVRSLLKPREQLHQRIISSLTTMDRSKGKKCGCCECDYTSRDLREDRYLYSANKTEEFLLSRHDNVILIPSRFY